MSIDLDSLAATVERPDEQPRARLRAHLTALTGFPGALGRLEEPAARLAGMWGAAPMRPVSRPRMVLFAADHGVARAGVSRHDPRWTAQAVRAVLDGGSIPATLAGAAGAGVRVVDLAVDADPFPGSVSAHRVRRGTEPLDRADALTTAEAERAFRAGAAVADEEVDAGADLLAIGCAGVGSTTVAAVLIGALTGMDAAAVIGRGSGIDDATWIRKCAAIRDALRRARPVLGDPLRLLAVSGGADFAAMTGFLLQCAARRTPVVLDGVATAASALVAQRIAYRAPDWWFAGHVTPEPGHVKALDRMGLEPLLDYGIRYGQGTGALLALRVLCSAAEVAACVPPSEAGAGGPGDGTPVTLSKPGAAPVDDGTT